MAETKYSWPARGKASIIGKRSVRLDGAAKASGAAKYTYDVNLPKQLIVKSLDCPHAHCRIKSIDKSAAEKVPGVVHIHVFPHAEPGKEIEWKGELLIAVAAETEAAANEGVQALKVDYEKLDVFVQDDDLKAAEAAGRTGSGGTRVETVREPGDDDDEDQFVEQELQRLFNEAAVVVEGQYGIDAITHCCLEPHGSTVSFKDGKLLVYLSTQNVSGSDDGFANAMGIAAGDVEVQCQYIGGGFGSKFAPEYWGLAAAEISKQTGRPVKFMLDRDQELMLGGNRPSGYITVKLGADREGVVQVWDSHQWGTGGNRGGGVSNRVIPYVFAPKNYRAAATTIATNTAPARAWRAPNHPQACAITQVAYDDLAAKLGMDSRQVFKNNLANIGKPEMAGLYRDEIDVAAKLIQWDANWHPHGKGEARGSIVEGLGLAIHEWGGVANTSSCQLRIHPDGSVESFCGTQDLGTGTRTVCAMVLAETFGLNVEDVTVNIGSSKYPNSGASGGSTTVGAVSESHRRAAQDALVQIFDKVAAKLESSPEALEAVQGRIRDKNDPQKSVSWKEACVLLGMRPLEVTSDYQRGTRSPLSSEGVGGVQMAHVAVDRETGIVKMKKFVAVQDMGLIINRQTAESQIYGAAIMGIAYALFEQRLMDPASGAFINDELSDYQLARLGDTGEIVVELYEPDDQRDRGVIGLGEPPVISPGAAISNAVCNALGVRVPVLPMTPKRVLEAIQKASGRA